MPKAFVGPLVLRERLGSLEPAAVAEAELDPMFRERPAIHRYPGAMAERVHALAAHVMSATTATRRRSGARPETPEELRANLEALPGFGEMKVTAVAEMLAKRFGVALADRWSRTTRRSATSTPGVAGRVPGGEEGRQDHRRLDRVRRCLSPAQQVDGASCSTSARLVGRAGALVGLRDLVRDGAPGDQSRTRWGTASRRDQGAIERGTKTSKRGRQRGGDRAARRPPAGALRAPALVPAASRSRRRQA